MNDAVDIAIIGAGPAGMSAALKALSLGVSVRVFDEQATPGGQIYRNVLHTDARRVRTLGPDYLAGQTLAQAFATDVGKAYEPRASVWHVEPSDGEHLVHYTQRERSLSIRARFVVHCGGAQERPFPVPGWTLPGVMTAGAAQVLLKQDSCVPSQPVVLAGCGPLLYLIAYQYMCAGVTIRAVLDTTSTKDYWKSFPLLLRALMKPVAWTTLGKGTGMLRRLKRAEFEWVSGVTRVAIEAGEHGRVASVKYVVKGQTQRIDTALVLLHQGVVPNVQFSRAMDAEHRWKSPEDCWVPVTDVWGELAGTGVFIAGDGRGIVGAKAAAIQGRLAALAVAARIGRTSNEERDRTAKPEWRALDAETAVRPMLNLLYRAKPENRVPRDGVVVCRCEEVDATEIRRSVALGCQGPNHVKAFTRCGMGPCQGASCGLTVTELIADASHISPDAVGAFRVRPPIKPVTLRQLANAVVD
ncbi:Hydrogen cyanide synthase subunit HcnB [Paraburkholderia aspalathi]|uniref:FAD/NAD(P)-dependent oxidoreductase n=1 Tax=Paraburkholderia aspalathi TaxID=1324617 RepID=UPI001909F319|nr:NAD(P)/FAD-dependent oxidoreductase [Paraburkholderia aspalathi]MBK3843204.1 FAD-dependent oxidoreductase [Paraburkholderia aspalathi]CAE6847897.1 Hydrogen cyanide synthase subunit HcnB [Paraburkholderia aspalathi]CAE6858113.1 Hydrogen cyanide synthase subunit HcnB [Paraburkholderia aspalathi]